MQRWARHGFSVSVVAWIVSTLPSVLVAEPSVPVDWPTYGGGAGLRYSPLSDIAAANVEDLEIAWVHHSGDVSDGKPETPDRTAYEATPIVVDAVLYVCSPFNRVFALDAETGEERWVYDPKIDRTLLYGNQAVCRGVSIWPVAGALAGSRRP